MCSGHSIDKFDSGKQDIFHLHVYFDISDHIMNLIKPILKVEGMS